MASEIPEFKVGNEIIFNDVPSVANNPSAEAEAISLSAARDLLSDLQREDPFNPNILVEPPEGKTDPESMIAVSAATGSRLEYINNRADDGGDLLYIPGQELTSEKPDHYRRLFGRAIVRTSAESTAPADPPAHETA